MPDFNDDPAGFRNKVMEIYLRDTYLLYFRENMQAAFTGIDAETVEAAYSRQKTYADTAFDLFKRVLYQQIPLEDARAQIRRQDECIREDNWLACEALTLQHLMKHSDPTSTTPEIWQAFETIVREHYRPYVDTRNPGSDYSQHNVPVPPAAHITNRPAFVSEADVINQALAFSLEWGENFGKPIYARMRQVYPHLSDPELETLQQTCNRIKSTAWQAYEEVYAEKIGGDEARRRIQAVFPDIDERNLSSLATQGMYYAWHG